MTRDEIYIDNLLSGYKKVGLWQYIKFKFTRIFEILESWM